MFTGFPVLEDRKNFQTPFTKGSWPEWKCPTCGVGLLQLRRKTLHKDMTGPSKLETQHPAWDVEWVEQRFSCLFYCNNEKCAEVCCVSGTGTVSEEPQDDLQTIEYVEYFAPRFFLPAPLIFSAPRETPEELLEALHDSFTAYWVEPSQAANKIRQTIELLLDHLGIQKQSPNGKLIKLHHRIEALEGRGADLREQLLAIKWLGNTGSHEGGLTKDDVLDAYEILDHVFTELFGNRQRVAELTREINERKGKPRNAD